LRQLLAILILVACVFLLAQRSSVFQRKEMVNLDDYVEYWAAGRLNLTGGNPYSPAQLLPLQLNAGRTFEVPVMMWNPPFTLALVMPFGAVDYPLSRFLWFLSQTTLVLFCASFIWRFYRGPPRFQWVAWLIAFSFLPTLFTLKTGQIPGLILLGTVLFLEFTKRRVWWLASLAFLLMAIKPHTIYLVPLAFLFWAVSQRRWTLLAGSGVVMALATGIALLFNPLVLKQYIYAIRHYPPSYWATPTLGGMLRYFIGIDHVWLQFLPTALGVVWFCFYWSKKRLDWNWPEQMPLLVAVSVLTASYGWTCDYVVLLLVILSIAAELIRRGWDPITRLAVGLYLVIDAVTIALNLTGGIRNDFWFMWLAPALAGWYFLMVRLGVVRLSS
jgi:Glycosyltransferase family 87